MDISCVCITYNRQEKVKSLIELLRKFHGDNLEIVCVSDGCNPKPDVEHMCNKFIWQEDLGNRTATARNAGILATTNEKICMLDDDIEPHPLNLQAHSLCLEMYDLSYGLLPEGGWHRVFDSRTRFYFDETELLWKFSFTGNMAMRRSAFDKIGPFDERFNGGHGFEDIDWGFRAKQAGLRTHFNQLAMALHPQSHHASDEEFEPVLINRNKFHEKWEGALENGIEIR